MTAEAMVPTFAENAKWVTRRKRVEKLKYMHRNPVKRGLVLEPEQWIWSSYRHYAFGQAGPVLVNEQKAAELKLRRAAV